MAKKIPTTTDLENPALDREELIIKQAKDDFEMAATHWQVFREKASDCLDYINSDYLRSDYMANREASGMPALTENRIPSFHETVVSQLRQNQPAIQIDAASEQTDPQFAEQLSDSIRGIEQDSTASIAYGTAAWYAVGTGIGYARVLNDWVDDESMDQHLRIAPIEDPSTVYFDPSHKCLVGSDAGYVLIVNDMPYNTYIRKYGKGKMKEFLSTSGVHGFSAETTKKTNGWITDKTVRVAEYYVKEWFTKTLYQYWDAKIGALRTTFDKSKAVDLRDSREVKTPVIKYYVLNDKEILEEETWPGKFIPVVACKGIEFWNQTERVLKGMVDDMRDPQRRLDFIINWQAEMMMLAPKAPYIGTATMFEDNQDDWANANLSNIAYLTFKPDPLAANMKPERDVVDVQLNSSQQFYLNAVEGIKAVTGMSQPLVGLTLGESNTPESGKALNTRIQQSHESTFHFQDHIRHFIAHIGQVIVDAFPTFYGGSGRSVMATKQNGDQYQAIFNDQDDKMLETAKFKVRVETGPAYATVQQENMDRGMEIMRTNPNDAPLIQDLVAEQGQGEYWKKIAARLRAAVPPQILAATEDMDKQEGPQQIANLKTQVASLTANVQKLTAEVQPDKDKIQKLEMQVQFEKHDNSYDLEKTKLAVKQEQDRAAFDQKKLDIEEQKIILEAEIKRRELDLEERELAIKERQADAEIQIKAVAASAKIANDTMEHHHKVQENINSAKDGVDGEDIDDVTTESRSGSDGDMNDLSLK